VFVFFPLFFQVLKWIWLLDLIQWIQALVVVFNITTSSVIGCGWQNILSKLTILCKLSPFLSINTCRPIYVYTVKKQAATTVCTLSTNCVYTCRPYSIHKLCQHTVCALFANCVHKLCVQYIVYQMCVRFVCKLCVHCMQTVCCLQSQFVYTQRIINASILRDSGQAQAEL